MPPTQEQLKPCPFCGQKAEMKTFTSPAPGCEDFFEAYISCGCKDSPFLDEDCDELAKKWNTRAKSDGWIAVSERLPEFHTFCSVFEKYGNESEPALYTSIGFVDLNQSALSDGRFEYFNDVTHWQPLPQPPLTEGGK